MMVNARIILFSLCLIGGLSSVATAQSHQAVAVDIGFKLAQYPQVGVQVLPDSRFEFGLAAYIVFFFFSENEAQPSPLS